jgi:hypothetical protein
MQSAPASTFSFSVSNLKAMMAILNVFQITCNPIQKSDHCQHAASRHANISFINLICCTKLIIAAISTHLPNVHFHSITTQNTIIISWQ